MCRNAAFRFLVPAFLILLSARFVGAESSVPVRVGTYDNPPKIYRDERGQIGGFQADIVRAVMARGGLPFVFVHGTWQEGLDRLRAGDIDVMADVAYSDARSRIFDFNGETVFINWAAVYTRSGTSLESVLALDGLAVAGMRGDIHTEGSGGLLSLAEQFGISLRYIPTESYEAAFAAVRDGSADAAVVNRIFGLSKEDEYRLKRSNVVFDPIAIKFAFNKESPRTARLIGLFDSALAEMKADSDSVFYRSMDRYLPGFVEKRSFIPQWMRVALPAVSAVLVASLVFLAFLGAEIRRRRKVEAELVRAKDAAEAASRAKSSFLANTSHEIRTPMNAVLGYAQILRADPAFPSPYRSSVDRIIGGGEHLLSIINDILDMSKIEAGRVGLESAPFDPRSAMEDVVSMARVKAESKGLVLSLSVSPSIPARILGDEGKFRQIILNLVGNAIKFTPAGRVSLSADAEDRPPAPGGSAFLRFAVADTGIGISQEDLGRIFDPFEQAQAGAVSREGTGLGLSISRKLARLMGGDIVASSRPGEGSVFVFTAPFPVASSASSALSDSTASPAAGSALHGLRVAAPHTVLIADDRESNRDILDRMLTPFGFVCIHAADGAEALRLFVSERPSVVLIDLAMPVMDGFSAVSLMRAHEIRGGLPRTPILVVSASAMPEEKNRVLAVGADEFIRKPFKLESLVECLGRFIEFAPQPPAEAPVPPPADPSVQDIRRGLESVSPELKSAVARAVLIGDVSGLRRLAAETAVTAPSLSSALARASESFDFSALKEAAGG